MFTPFMASPAQGIRERIVSRKQGHVTADATAIVDWRIFSQTRAELGAGFVRIMSYFHEDGVKSVAAIEQAMRRLDAAALVIPAHTLKGEALHFGAEPLGALAEHIEHVARRCVETRESPSELVEHVVRLRPLFEQTLAVFERETNPLAERRPAFGRKTQPLPGVLRA
jgi:HPt (histidine-containing phosphotransfer) domain-containing protein